MTILKRSANFLFQRKIARFVTPLGFLVILYFLWKFFIAISPSPAPEIKVVEVETATLKDIQQTARLLGTLRPKHMTVMIAKTAGTLDSLISPGEFVKKGTVIAKIDNADIERSHTLSTSAEAIAKAQYERVTHLSQKDFASKKSVEDQKNAWIEAQKALAFANIELDKTQFKAPFDGIVGVYKIREGTQVEMGNPVVSFYDPSHLMIEFDVPDNLLSSIKDGQQVKVLGKSYPITHVQRMIDEETHMCPAYVDVSCETCTIGTSLDLDITLKDKKNVIVIPVEAVFLREGKFYVYTIKNEKAQLTPVTLGIREKDHIEITSGLTPGETFVSLQPGRLFPDMPVKIHQPSPTAP